MPLFSILIANYNNGSYLWEAIESVLSQTYLNWEVILVDDKSTDDSKEIYKRVVDDCRFHIYYNETNKGCGYTKRRCIEEASGEFCGFLDPDDKLSEDAIQCLVNEHRHHPECSLVYSTLFLWDPGKVSTAVLDQVGAMKEGEDFLISSQKIVSHFAVFKKSFYQETIGINSSLQSAVDVDLYFKLEEVGSICFYDKPLYYYRQGNPSSISIGNDALKSKAFKNRIRVSLDAFLRRIKEGSPLFLQKKDKYLHRMRWQLSFFRKNIKRISWDLMRYCYYYMKADGFSLKSANHVRKVLF